MKHTLLILFLFTASLPALAQYAQPPIRLGFVGTAWVRIVTGDGQRKLVPAGQVSASRTPNASDLSIAFGTSIITATPAQFQDASGVPFGASVDAALDAFEAAAPTGGISSGGSSGTLVLATQSQATTGSDNSVYMSPLRTSQAIANSLTNYSTTTANNALYVAFSGSYNNPAWLTSLAGSKVSEDATHRWSTDAKETIWNGKQDATQVGNAISSAMLNANNLNAGTVPLARIGTGTPAAGKYLDGTNTWVTLPAGGGGGGTVTYAGNRKVESFSYSGSPIFTPASVPTKIYQVQVYNAGQAIANPNASYSFTTGASSLTITDALQTGDRVYVDYEAAPVSLSAIGTIDSAPVLGSSNAVSSGGVASAIQSLSSTMSRVMLTTDVTNANSTANTIADVTGLSFPVSAGITYKFRFYVTYTSAATTTGSRWAVSGPSFTSLIYQSFYSLTATSRSFNEGLSAYDLPATVSATSAATTGNTAVVEGLIKPLASGTLILRFASEIASSAITAKSGLSYVEFQAIN